MFNPSETDTLPPPPVAMDPSGKHKTGFPISGDKVHIATADLPDDQRDAIRWAAGYCRAKNLHHSDFALLLKKPDGEPYSKDSVYHMFTGGRGETALVFMVEAIQRLRKVEDGRQNLVRASFVETRIAKRIFQVCRRAFLRQKLVLIFAESQVGKSTALEEYFRRNGPGVETVYVRMPTGGTMGAFIREFARVLGFTSNGSFNIEDVKQRIIACFDSRMLLIVDECEECLNDRRESGKGVNTLNFIREIHDQKKCGVVIAGAPDLKRGLFTGRNSNSMRRLVRRSMIPLQLPAIPSDADLATFARHFGLPPIPDEVVNVRFKDYNDAGDEIMLTLSVNPTQLQADIIKQHGLGRWTMILTEASDLAKEKRKEMSWGFVLRAHDDFSRMEKMSDDKKEAA